MERVCGLPLTLSRLLRFYERMEIMEKAIKKYFPVFALPTLVAFTIGFIVPFIMGIYLSFCEFTTVTDANL